MLWTQNVESTQWDLWLLPMHGDRKPVPYLRTAFDETSAAISPDGHWLAHDSNETGRAEIYVRSLRLSRMQGLPPHAFGLELILSISC